MNRKITLDYILNHIEYDIGFTEVGLRDKSNTQEEIQKMNDLIKWYNDIKKYVEDNLK